VTAVEHDHRPQTRFTLPTELAAAEPPEARGLARDAVRLLATTETGIQHARFAELGRFLHPGDLLVVNTSATRASALDAEHPRTGPVVVHFSTELDDGSWVIELRTAPSAEHPLRSAEPGEQILLPDGQTLTLRSRYPANGPRAQRLWRTPPLPAEAATRLLAAHGRPIRYGYLSAEWPLSSYQTVFVDPADPQASAEMPSAGRPFSNQLVAALTAAGVRFAPIALHAGVSSLESGEPPLAERFRVPARTARLVNRTRQPAAGPGARGPAGRVIAVGTTVTRALESAADPDGQVHAAEGWTELVLGPDHPIRAVDGLITGLHDPDASHLLLLEAVAGAERVQSVYDAALDQRYLWHEFGDTCLLLR
jgi:S-adenosylmethionine:tRNA ribosyltransferase-isomerase